MDSKAKKISFQKVEEKENSIPTLIQKGEIDDIKKILEEDPSVINKTSRFGKFHNRTLLFVAISFQRIEVAKLLLEKGAAKNLKNSKEKETCLHRATRLQNLELVKLLLEHKANRKLKDKHGLRPLDIAKRLYRDCLSKDRRQKLKEIINELQIIDTCSTNRIRESEESRDDRETSLSDLFSNSTSLEDSNCSFTDQDISIAIAKNDDSSVAKYLSASGNPNFINSRSHSLLECAFASKNEKIVELLLRSGADPNTQFSFGSRPLHRACSFRMVSSVKILLEMGANPTLKDNKNRDPMSRIRVLRSKNMSTKKSEKIRDDFNIMKKLIKQKLDEWDTGNIQNEIDKISILEDKPSDINNFDTLKLD